MRDAYQKLGHDQIAPEYYRNDDNAVDLMLDLEMLSGAVAGMVQTLLDTGTVPAQHRDIVRESFISRATWFVRHHDEPVDLAKYPRFLQSLHLMEDVREMIVEALA
ncbi:MAG: hypothetical protein ACYSX0_22365 [Planctomycetota bacterium]